MVVSFEWAWPVRWNYTQKHFIWMEPPLEPYTVITLHSLYNYISTTWYLCKHYWHLQYLHLLVWRTRQGPRCRLRCWSNYFIPKQAQNQVISEAIAHRQQAKVNPENSPIVNSRETQQTNQKDEAKLKDQTNRTGLMMVNQKGKQSKWLDKSRNQNEKNVSGIISTDHWLTGCGYGK